MLSCVSSLSLINYANFLRKILKKQGLMNDIKLNNADLKPPTDESIFESVLNSTVVTLI
jgi:hypothetical protein